MCYVRYRVLRSVTNVFIVSMSASDLIVALVSVPFSFGVFVCQIQPLTEIKEGKTQDMIYSICDMAPSMWSIYSLTLVAIDRALAISKPFFHRRYITRTTAWVSVCVTWVLAVLFIMVIFLINREDFTMYIITVSYIIPVIIMVICYTVMGYVAKSHAKELNSLEKTATRLRNESNTSLLSNKRTNSMVRYSGKSDKSLSLTETTVIHGEYNTNGVAGNRNCLSPKDRRKSSNFFSRSMRRLSSNANTSRLLKRELKAAMTLALILGCFILSWTPFVGVNIEYYRNPNVIFPPHMVKYFKVLHYLNSSVNPVLYILLNKRWRAAFRMTICQTKKDRKQSESTQTELFGW